MRTDEFRRMVSRAALSACLLSCSLAVANAQTISLGNVSQTSTSWPQYVAEQKGIFSKHGVQLDNVQIGTSEGMQATGAGSLNAMHGPCNSHVAFAERGGQNTVIGLVTVSPHPGVVVASKAITSVEQLKGKAVGVASVNSGSTVLVRRLLESKGLVEADYGVIGGQGTAQLYAGLKAGAYDAVYSVPPYSAAAKAEGFTILGGFSEVAPNVPFTCIAFNTGWLKDNAETARGFVSAWLEAVTWLQASGNREEATSILATTLKLEPAVAEATYAEMIGGGRFPADGAFTDASFAEMIDVMVRGGEVPEAPDGDLTSFFDNSLLPR